MIKKIRNIALILFICFQVSYSQVEYFNRIHSHHIASVPYGVIEKDSAYYIGGTLVDSINGNYSRIFLEKYSRNGDFLWSKSWGNYLEYFAIGWLSPIITTSDGGFATIGGINDTSGIWHGVLMKHNSNGDTVWMKHFYDTISAYISDFLALRSIKETYDKGFIIVGKIKASHQWDSDMFLLKTDSLGNTEWYKTIGNSKTIDSGVSVIQTPDSGYVISGSVWNASIAFSQDAYLIKTDKYGNVIWEKPLGGPYSDGPAHVDLAYDSNYIVAFSYAYEENPPVHAMREIHVLKVSPLKQVLWYKQFHIHRDQGVRCLYEQLDHTIVIIGNSYISDTVNLADGFEAFIMKLSENGDSLWYRDIYYQSYLQYGEENSLHDFKLTSDGGFIACGRFMNVIQSIPESTWIVKMDSLGCDTPGCSTVGIKDPIEIVDYKTTNVYPNPVSNFLKIEINIQLSGILKFELYDSYARKVKEILINQQSYTVSVSDLNNGIYFYRLKVQEKLLSKGKVLVVR